MKPSSRPPSNSESSGLILVGSSTGPKALSAVWKDISIGRYTSPLPLRCYRDLRLKGTNRLGDGESLSGYIERKMLKLEQQVLNPDSSIQERHEILQELYNLGQHTLVRERVWNTLLAIGNEDSGWPLELRKQSLRFADLLQFL